MRTVLANIFFGKGTAVNGLIALMVISAVVLGCTCNKGFDLSNLGRSSSNAEPDKSLDTGNDAVPSNAVVEGLVKSTTAEFAEAVETGDFSEMHANASKDFQSSFTVDEFRTAFRTYLDKKAVVVPILKMVADTDADLSPEPMVRSEKGIKILVAKGTFPTKPYGVRFDYEYVLRGGEWKLLKLGINIP